MWGRVTCVVELRRATCIRLETRTGSAVVPCALLKASSTILQFCVWVSASKNVSSFMNGSIANTVPKSAIVEHSSSTWATTRCSCTCSSK